MGHSEKERFVKMELLILILFLLFIIWIVIKLLGDKKN